jgi:pimeloyl-ACP methyl ester carboxylesterase
MAAVSRRLGRSNDVFLGQKGYRVIAHDRRGHGRSTQTATGDDMDTYADDAYEVVKKLDLKNAVHIGHSTGGGEVTRYVARHGKGRVKKAVLISAIPPLFMKTDKNPDGVPKEVVVAFATAPQTIVPNSIKTSPCRSTDSIGLARRYPKEFERIGGDRE